MGDGARAEYDEGVPGRVDLALGLREGERHPPTDLVGVLERLRAWGVLAKVKVGPVRSTTVTSRSAPRGTWAAKRPPNPQPTITTRGIVAEQLSDTRRTDSGAGYDVPVMCLLSGRRSAAAKHGLIGELREARAVLDAPVR
jgi:hypothetical protein